MTDHLIDHFEDGSVAVLSRNALGQAVGRQVFEDFNRLAYCRFEREKKLGDLIGREFLVAIADVGLATDSRSDPLADVAGQVQYQIADGVLRVMGAIPYLIRSEL